MLYRGGHSIDPTLTMPNEAFSRLLASTAFPKARHIVLQHEAFDRPLCAVQVDHGNSVHMWKDLRREFSTSGYWPLVVSYIGSGSASWDETVLRETKDQFSRFYFEEESQAGRKGAKTPDPRAILDASVNTEFTYALEAKQLEDTADLQDEMNWRLERLVEAYGAVPDRDDLIRQVEASVHPQRHALEQGIFEWELQRGEHRREPRAPFWYEPEDPLALLLLPIADGFDALAHIHWWGSFALGTPATIALMRSWNSRHGAELMCHYGTVLQLHVAQPIADPREAFEVAAAMEVICMQESPSETAWDLLGARHWHLHNRP